MVDFTLEGQLGAVSGLDKSTRRFSLEHLVRSRRTVYFSGTYHNDVSFSYRTPCGGAVAKLRCSDEPTRSIFSDDPISIQLRNLDDRLYAHVGLRRASTLR